MGGRRVTALVVGATGSVGRLVVEEALREGHAVRALVRDTGRARPLPPDAQVVVGDVTRPDSLAEAVDGVDAVVFTLGSDGAGKAGAETVDYGGVRNVLRALGSRPARVALMTSIGVTNRDGRLQPPHRGARLEAALRAARASERAALHDRAARLVRLQRAGPAPPRPAAGRPAPGGRSERRRHRPPQIAQVLVRSLTSPEADRKTFELIATAGAAQQDLGPLFAALDADAPGSLDAVHDAANMPLEEEPRRVRDDLPAHLPARAARCAG